MKRMKLTVALAAVLAMVLSACTVQMDGAVQAAPEPAAQEAAADETVGNGQISFVMPGKLSGLYEAEVANDSIDIFDKGSRDAGFGGFVFGIFTSEDPGASAGNMCLKIGELTAADGTLFDVLLRYPSDVQYDYVKDDPRDYFAILDSLAEIVPTIAGVDGGEYVNGAGTKGDDLYAEFLLELLEKASKAGTAEMDEELSPMYTVIYASGEDVFERIGYAFKDINDDGVDELLIGDTVDNCVYDIFTMVDRKPAHCMSGWDRNRLYISGLDLICNEYSSGAEESGFRVLYLIPNQADPYEMICYKYDGYEDPENPWFVSYYFDEAEGDFTDWESITEDQYDEGVERFTNYARIDYIPLSTVAGE